MKITAFLILVLFSFGFATAQAQEKKDFDPTTLSEAGKSAYQKLLVAGVFSIGGVGYDGKISDSEKAMEVLLLEQNGVAAFKSLVTDATPEGGLYALAGLYVKDFQIFKDESVVYLKRNFTANRKVGFPFTKMKDFPKDSVVIQGGCESFIVEAKMIVEMIESDKFGWNLKRYAEKK